MSRTMATSPMTRTLGGQENRGRCDRKAADRELVTSGPGRTIAGIKFRDFLGETYLVYAGEDEDDWEV